MSCVQDKITVNFSVGVLKSLTTSPQRWRQKKVHDLQLRLVSGFLLHSAPRRDKGVTMVNLNSFLILSSAIAISAVLGASKQYFFFFSLVKSFQNVKALSARKIFYNFCMLMDNPCWKYLLPALLVIIKRLLCNFYYINFLVYYFKNFWKLSNLFHSFYIFF